MFQEKNFDSEFEVSLFFKKFGISLVESISIPNIQFDAYQLNLLESSLGKEKEMNLHYDLVLNGQVSEYNRFLAKGQNILFENLQAEEKNVIFGGRLAQYKYYDMHQVLASALTTAKQELGVS